ncbi:hypothetical protein ES703_105880 [subsurface metagenome]
MLESLLPSRVTSTPMESLPMTRDAAPVTGVAFHRISFRFPFFVAIRVTTFLFCTRSVIAALSRRIRALGSNDGYNFSM